MKKIFKIFICVFLTIVCTSCIDRIRFRHEQNNFIVKKIETEFNISGYCRYYLYNFESNNGNDVIELIDLPNKYQYGDTLKFVKFSK